MPHRFAGSSRIRPRERDDGNAGAVRWVRGDVILDQNLSGSSATESETMAQHAELCGYGGMWATESTTDPFVQAYGMIRSTSRVQVGTGIAVAFARNPMTTAYSAWELASASNGRFVLGLGTQVKAHVERRYSMPWSEPARRLEDFILALRDIWSCWQDGAPLSHEGDFYQHTLMSPTFTPPHHLHELCIATSAVGPRMMSLAGRVCDGLLLHPLINGPYLDGTALPNVAAGLESGGRDASRFFVSCSTFMIMGDTDEQVEDMRRQVQARIAFYASTPTYKDVLAAIGYDQLHLELRDLARAQQWDRMTELIDDDVMGFFSVEGKPEDMPTLVHERYGSRVDRVSSYFGWPFQDPDRMKEIAARFASVPDPSH